MEDISAEKDMFKNIYKECTTLETKVIRVKKHVYCLKETYNEIKKLKRQLQELKLAFADWKKNME